MPFSGYRHFNKLHARPRSNFTLRLLGHGRLTTKNARHRLGTGWSANEPRCGNAAFNDFVIETIRNAEALFIAGGDQSEFVQFWK